MLIKNIVSHASRCRLNINCGAMAAFAGGKTPAASLSVKSLAAEKKPMRISSLAIFCHAAVVVIMTSTLTVNRHPGIFQFAGFDQNPRSHA